MRIVGDLVIHLFVEEDHAGKRFEACQFIDINQSDDRRSIRKYPVQR